MLLCKQDQWCGKPKWLSTLHDQCSLLPKSLANHSGNMFWKPKRHILICLSTISKSNSWTMFYSVIFTHIKTPLLLVLQFPNGAHPNRVKMWNDIVVYCWILWSCSIVKSFRKKVLAYSSSATGAAKLEEVSSAYVEVCRFLYISIFRYLHIWVRTHLLIVNVHKGVLFLENVWRFAYFQTCLFLFNEL